MSDPTVKMVFSGNGADAERAITSLEKKYESLEQKLKRTSATSKQGFGSVKTDVLSLDSALAGAATRMVSFAASGAAAQAVLAGMSQKAHEAAGKVNELWAKQGPEQLKLQLATGMDAAALQKMMPKLKEALFQTPALSLPEMTTMAAEIAGAGFADKDVESGAAAAAMLRVRAGMGAFGKDTEPASESAKAISALLAAQGSQMGAADIERVGMRTAALAAKTNLAFSDLKQLSQAAGALSQLGIDESKMLAAFAVTSEAGGAMVGSTGLKNIGLRLGTAAGDKERQALLKSVGLSPEDVAIAKGGVDLTTAGERLRDALSKRSEVERNVFFSKFFGGETVASASTLFSDAGFAKYKERVQIAENAQQEMGQRLQTFEKSRFAVGRRHQLRQEFAAHDIAQRNQTEAEFSEFRAGQLMTDQEQAKTSFERSVHAAGAYGLSYFDSLNKMFSIPAGQKGFHALYGGFGAGPPSPTDDAGWAKVAEQQLEEQKRNNELLEEQNRLLRENRHQLPRPLGQREGDR